MADRNKGDDPAVTAPPRASDQRRANEGSAFNFDARRDSESVPELVRDLVHQGSQLAEQQTRLVQAEVRSAIGELTTAAGAMAGAAVVAIAGLGVLLMGVSFLLARAIPLWAATLLVAVATMIVAYAMFAGGRKKLQESSVNMERTRHTIERAPSAISEILTKDRIMAAEQSDDPARIQEEVEQTQDAMGETIQKLEDKLSPRKFAQSLLSDENSDTAREAWEVVRRNPVPVALIGVGAAWLLAASDAPLIRRWREELKAKFRGAINDRASGAGIQARAPRTASGGPPPPAGEAYDRRLDPDVA